MPEMNDQEIVSLLVKIDREVTKMGYTIHGTGASIGLAQRVETIESRITEYVSSWNSWKKVEGIGTWVIRVVVVTGIMSAIGLLIKLSGMVG